MLSYKKMTFLFSLAALFAVPQLVAVNFQESFLQANEVYAKQDYAKALSLYNVIEPKGSSVWYNMGNCAYNLQDYAHALLYWRRAEVNASRAQIASIAHNIRQLEAHMPNIAALQTGSYAYNTGMRVLSFVPPLLMQMLSIFLLLCIVWLFFSSALKRRKRFFIVAALVLWVGVTLTAYTHYIGWHTPRGLVVQEEVTLNTGPHPDYHSLATLPRFAQVMITKKEDGWLQVRYNNLVGWLFADTIAEI